jgi:hypothetical protein
MSQALLFELEHNQRRLKYYLELKDRAESGKSPYDKWVEIYSDRVRKLENQANKLGLKTQLQSARGSSSQRAS